MTADDRIESLLDAWHAALAAGREVPVADLCRDCPELLPEVARRAELLRKVMNLAATQSADAVTRSASDGTLTAPPSIGGPTSALPDAPPGYEILAEVARGGMGVVYRARQTGLNREVAIKTVLGASDSRGLIRFLAEAEAVAAVRHPHVVAVFDFGQHAGRPFLVMEYLPGGTLKDRLETSGKLTPRAAAELVGKVAAGVAAAHEQGIVHRDLKPGNVLFDESSEPKVADFGLAKRGSGSDLTRTQAVMGTPAYMAPEQARGNAKLAGPAADVWALGVILYECLMGTRPFDGEDAGAILHAVLNTDPKPPRSAEPAVPRDLDRVVRKCLEKEPHERYATAGELAADLGRFAAGEPVSVRSAGPVERLTKWARRKPTVVAAWALGMALVVLIGVTALVASLWRDAVVQHGIAESARDQLAEKKKEVELARDREATARGIAEQARDGEAKARSLAESGRDAESQARVLVEQQREKIAAFEYGRTMQVAYQEWRENNVVAARTLLDGSDPKLRGWEWHYLNRICDSSLLSLRGHTFPIHAAFFSPDGSRVVTGSDDRTAKVWDAKTGAELLTLKGHTDSVKFASFSPDGMRIVTASQDLSARVWDARTGVEVLHLRGHLKFVDSASFSPDGSRIVTGSLDQTARVWDAKTGAELLTLKGHSNVVTSATFSPDGSRIVTGSYDKTAKVWDAKSGAELLTLKSLMEFDVVESASFCPDGVRIVTAGGNGLAIVWDAKTGDEILRLRGHLLIRR